MKLPFLLLSVIIFYFNDLIIICCFLNYQKVRTLPRGGLAISFGLDTIWPNQPTNCRKCKSVGRSTQKWKCLHALTNFFFSGSRPFGHPPKLPDRPVHPWHYLNPKCCLGFGISISNCFSIWLQVWNTHIREIMHGSFIKKQNILWYSKKY